MPSWRFSDHLSVLIIWFWFFLGHSYDLTIFQFFILFPFDPWTIVHPADLESGVYIHQPQWPWVKLGNVRYLPKRIKFVGQTQQIWSFLLFNPPLSYLRLFALSLIFLDRCLQPTRRIGSTVHRHLGVIIENAPRVPICLICWSICIWNFSEARS